MKSYLIVLICAILIPFAACKKKAFDPATKSQSDFIGTWKGSISTFKNNKIVKESGKVVIFPEAGGSLLGGIIFMTDISVFHQFQFSNGTLYFRMHCNDPLNPDCQNWSLSGYAVFSEEGKIEIRISGNECGSAGNEFVDWDGTLTPAQVSADSLQYYNFARTGNSWSYKITKVNGDSCQVQKQISGTPSNYNFEGTSTQTCGWSGQNMILKWSLLPYEFSITNDSTFSQEGIAFPIDAKIGVVYRTIKNNDTTFVTLTDKDLVVYTPAGIFTCVRFRYTEPVYYGVTKINRTAYLWLNNRFGIIRQEVVNPVDSGNIVTQVLSSKNF